MYRALPFVSNSDLGAYRLRKLGVEARCAEQHYQTGTAFHRLSLEPETIHELPLDVNLAQIQRMVSALRNSEASKWWLQFCTKEQVVIWREPTTGALCKSKLDMLYKRGHALDLKSTSATTFNAFAYSVREFDYDRQGAFYADAVGARKVTFIGVSKTLLKRTQEHRVLHYPLHERDFALEMGRVKYLKLLEGLLQERNLTDRSSKAA